MEIEVILKDRNLNRNKTRIEILLYRNYFREETTDPGLYKNLKIPDLEIRIGETCLSFLDKGNLFYYTNSINEVEKVLKYIQKTWEEENKKGIDIPFSAYLKVTSGRIHDAA
ncbi:hypothetical protein [Leptospira noguchii]|uniref:hypothetical protein n=1 Tax=Leptospira noguchii TaxID=28182 RepID=UPI0002F92E73|nr:hypothetical protein [Leptospira noguchii]AGS80613.1 hypothetical protein LEP1GSC059_0028 [Leptospira phage vB_LnoZ_CZ214-LE1]